MNLSIGRPVPANAHAPKGQKFNLTLQSSRRPASRSSYITKNLLSFSVEKYIFSHGYYIFKPVQHKLKDDAEVEQVVPVANAYNQEQSTHHSS